MKEIKVRVTVRSYEIDSIGHVNNSVYLNYLEHARVEFMRVAGFSLNEIETRGVFPVMVNVNINYKKPAFVYDELELTCKVVKVGRSSVTDEINVYNAKTGELLCESNNTYVFVDGKTNKSVPIPSDFLESLELDSTR